MLSPYCLNEVYKLNLHDRFPQKTLEKMLAEKKLYTIQKCTDTKLDDEMDYGYIVKGSEPSSTTKSLEIKDLMSLNDLVQKQYHVLQVNDKKKYNELMMEELKKKDKQITNLQSNFKKQEKEIEDLKYESKKKDKKITEKSKEIDELKGNLEIVFKASMLKKAFKHLANNIALPYISSRALSKYTSNEKPKWISILDCYFDSNFDIENIPITLQQQQQLWSKCQVLIEKRKEIYNQLSTVQLEFNTDIEEKFLNWYKNETRNIDVPVPNI